MTHPAFDLLARLPSPRDDEPRHLRQDIADELADHLACALHRELVKTGDADIARKRVLDRFGDPAAVARQLWFQAMWSRIMSQRILIGSALASVALLLLAVGMLGWFLVALQQRSDAQQAQLLATIQQLAADAAAKPAAVPAPITRLPLRVRLMSDDAEPKPVAGARVALTNPVGNRGIAINCAEPGDVDGAGSTVHRFLLGGGIFRADASVHPWLIARRTEMSLSSTGRSDVPRLAVPDLFLADVSNESGEVDLGYVDIGRYDLHVLLPWNESSVRSLVIQPGDSQTETVVVPASARASYAIQPKVNWPAEFRSLPLACHVRLLLKPRNIEGQNWWENQPSSASQRSTYVGAELIVTTDGRGWYRLLYPPFANGSERLTQTFPLASQLQFSANWKLPTLSPAAFFPNPMLLEGDYEVGWTGWVLVDLPADDKAAERILSQLPCAPQKEGGDVGRWADPRMPAHTPLLHWKGGPLELAPPAEFVAAVQRAIEARNLPRLADGRLSPTFGNRVELRRSEPTDPSISLEVWVNLEETRLLVEVPAPQDGPVPRGTAFEYVPFELPQEKFPWVTRSRRLIPTEEPGVWTLPFLVNRGLPPSWPSNEPGPDIDWLTLHVVARVGDQVELVAERTVKRQVLEPLQEVIEIPSMPPGQPLSAVAIPSKVEPSGLGGDGGFF